MHDQTSESGSGAAANGPRDGDLLLTYEPGEPCLYSLARVPGEPQVRCSSRGDALDTAGSFARRYRVDVWLRDGALVRRVVHARTGGGSPRSLHGRG
jgi:hypothetical protein